MNTNNLKQNITEYFSTKGYRREKATGLVSHVFPDTFNPSAAHEQVMDIIQMDEGLKSESKFYLFEDCFRNVDLHKVGKSHHNSYFQMFAYVYSTSTSIFNKRQIITEAIDFIKNCLKLDLHKIIFTVFGGGVVKNVNFQPDFETVKIIAELGVYEENIIYIQNENNFIYLERNGDAAGPRCEIFYDRGTHYKENRFIEIGSIIFENHFFKNGQLIESKNTVAGAAFGIERLSMVLNNYRSIYEIDYFGALRNYLFERIENKKLLLLFDFESNKIVDYFRNTICFILASGQLIDNTQRGKIIKKLLSQIRKKIIFLGLVNKVDFSEMMQIVSETHNVTFTENDKVNIVNILKNKINS